MYTDSDGNTWETFWKIAGGIAGAAVCVALVVISQGNLLAEVVAARG